MRKKCIWFAVAAVWLLPAGSDAAPSDTRREAPPVARSAPDLDCVIEPAVVVEVGSPVRGVLESVEVQRGDRVEPGQVLARLASDVEEASVALARARSGMQSEVRLSQTTLELGQRRRARADRLHVERAISEEIKDRTETDAVLAALQLEEARENQRVARLELVRARADLERRTIRSRLHGVVLERRMAPGERVDDETILRIAQIDPLRVEVIVPAALFGSIHTGMDAQVLPEPPGAGVHRAHVTLVDRVIDPASGTFGVRLELPNPDRSLPSGLRCQVRLLDERSVPAARGATVSSGP